MNTPKSAYETVRSSNWIAAAVVLLAALAFAYKPLFEESYRNWLKPDYSHGFLVPLFSAYLIYRSWPESPRKIRWPNLWGLAFLVVGLAIFLIIGSLNYAKEWIQGLSLVINLCGVVVLLGGWSALKWAWPAVAFLIFMFPLPYKVEIALGGYLQKIAAMGSEFVLQTIGYPTYREGVILHVKDRPLEIEKACNGLSMLLTFVALSVGMAIVVKRPWLDRILLLVAAIPVAILANVIRISLTGVLYSEGGKELGDKVFHDFAGWMMMPIALVILWLGLKVLDWVWVADLGQASREEVIRGNAANPALLFMHAIPGAEKGKPQNKPAAPAPAAKPTQAASATPPAPLP
ncbi:MAG TPA: exosortase/archaeosortase family protein [Gemmata sp.]|jgi:exosortase|nr:exosortase/archaeosortase family protein [Gemmata sp.]